MHRLQVSVDVSFLFCSTNIFIPPCILQKIILIFYQFFIKIQELDIDNCYILLYTVMCKEVKMDIIISNSSSIPIYEQLKKLLSKLF